uniref:LOB domain-containing protein n=1 Tax=Kalanchoe fedtschenkoi TaxID=63787 RepID=A0A7N0UEH9_KALFE
MSCNGCRVLRKGCKEDCILRQSLEWIQNPQAQGYATLFVARFFGRAGLFSFISAVPAHQRPGLFQSLLFEAAGRTVNPVSGSAGLLWTGNWQACQAAVEAVLRGGSLSPEMLAVVPEIDFFKEPGTVEVKTSATPDATQIETGTMTFHEERQHEARVDDLVEESETTTFESSSTYNGCYRSRKDLKLLSLFV